MDCRDGEGATMELQHGGNDDGAWGRNIQRLPIPRGRCQRRNAYSTQPYEEFAKNENKVWKKHTKIWIYKEDDYDESEEEVKCENCAHCGELMPCDNGCQTSHGFLCENCEDLYCCEDCGEIIEEDEEKFTSVDLERQLCEECYKEDERVTAEELREAKKQKAKDEALP